MPQRPLKPCSHPGCPQLTRAGKCEIHAKQAEAQYESRRGTATERGYDANWAKARTVKLNQSPLCERCLNIGFVIPAILVHHKDHNSRNNSPENYESLCQTCHDEEHKNERWKGRR